MYLDNVGRVRVGRRVGLLRNTGYRDREQDGRADNLRCLLIRYWLARREVARSCNCAHEIFALDSIHGPGSRADNIFLFPKYF